MEVNGGTLQNNKPQALHNLVHDTVTAKKSLMLSEAGGWTSCL